MSTSGDPILTHNYSRPFDEIYNLERIETIEFDDGNEYLIGTTFSEIEYYLNHEYKYSLKKELKEALKQEILEEIKKENNNH